MCIRCRSFFQQKYQELFGPQGLFANQTSLFPPNVFTLEAFVTAVATVRSRSHAPLEADKLSLVPLADAVSDPLPLKGDFILRGFFRKACSI